MSPSARGVVLWIAVAALGAAPGAGCDGGGDSAASRASRASRASARPGKAAPARRSSRSEPASHAEPLPDSWTLPDGWVWVTITQDGYAIGLPALPRAATNRERTLHLLVSEAPQATVTVIRRADGLDVVAQLREGAARAGARVTLDEPFGSGGRRIDLATTAGGEVNAVTSLGAGVTLLVNAVIPSGQEFDAAPLLDSLSLDDLGTPRLVRYAPGHFVVEAPSRLDEMADRSAPPPVLGVHGVLDGNQLSVLFVPASDDPASSSALEAAVRAKVAAMPGEIVSSEERTEEGRRERWVRCRARDGSPTVGALRMFFARGQLYTAAVFAPSGRMPPWADRFLGSLAVDPP